MNLSPASAIARGVAVKSAANWPRTRRYRNPLFKDTRTVAAAIE